MIQANELRVGNWVLDIDQRLIKSTAKTIELTGFNSVNFKFYPIPLTPEILEKAGFIKKDRYRETIFQKDGITFDSEYQLFTISIDDTEECVGQQLKYVHQLQNLYYALTGEELNI